MKQILTFLFIIVFLSFCTQNKQQSVEEPQNCEINSIYVRYFNFEFNSIKNIDCEAVLEAEVPDLDEDNMGLVNGTITNKNVLIEICTLLDSLKTSDSLSFDTRLTFTVYYKNGFIKSICADSFGHLLIDGNFYKSINRLTYLIKNNVGAYSWFDDEGLSFMRELKDTTFIKEPFIESPLKIQLEKPINH